MSSKAYNSTVAARTRAAAQILETPDLLAKFIEAGGLERDLTGIRDSGLEAEAAYIGRSAAKAEGKGATASVWRTFAEVQKEYKSIMRVVSTITAEAVRNEEPPELIAKLKGILANETEVSVSVVEEKDEAGNIEVKRKVKKSDAQEAIRMEISKDSDSLLSFSDILPRLDERRVTGERLSTLKSRADALAGMLADRAATKGDGKTLTQTTYDAVSLQRDIWSGVYRILASVGQRDERMRSLLKDARR